MCQSTAGHATTLHDGQHDFDFSEGTWHTHIVRTLDPFDPNSTSIQVEGTVSSRKVWGGRAWLEEIQADTPKGHWQAMNLFLYNPKAHQWGQSFFNSAAGELGARFVGEFKDGRAELYAQDTFEDKSILVRAVWSNISADAHRYEEDFSADGGKPGSSHSLPIKHASRRAKSARCPMPGRSPESGCARRGRALDSFRPAVPSQLLPHEPDVLPEEINLFGVRAWNPALDHTLLDLPKPGEQLAASLLRHRAQGFALQCHELAIALVNSGVDSPTVQLRQVLQAGNDHHKDRHQQHNHPIEQTRQPERQMAIHKALVARLVVACRFGVDGECVHGRSRELTGLLEQRGVTVHLHRRFDQQIADRRVQVGAYHQLDCRCQEVDVRGRQILPQVEGPGGNHQFVEVRKTAHIGAGLLEVE